MRFKCKSPYLMCFVLLFFLVVSGCSMNGEGAIVDNSQQRDEQEMHESSTFENETADNVPESGPVDNAPEIGLTDNVPESGAADSAPEGGPADNVPENGAADNAPEKATVTDDTSKDQVSEEMKNVDEREHKLAWELLSESVVKTKVFYAGFLDDSLGITVGYGGEISYTEDGGVNWSKSDNVSACRYGLDFYDETFIVCSGNSGVNLVSNDKGKTWSSLSDFPLKISGQFNRFLSVIDKDNMYIGSSISFAVTKDGGLSWNELEIPENCTKIEGMFFMTPEIGYLMNKDGTLYKTKDGCKTWTTQAIDLSGEINATKMPSVAINFQDEDHGMIVYTTKSYQLICIRTEDGGSTWESVTLPKVSCFTPYLSRDGQYLTLCSITKKICLYTLATE